MNQSSQAGGPRPRRYLRAFLIRGTVVLFGLLLAATIGEVALRVAGYSRTYYNPLGSFHEPHPLVGYRGRPGFVGRFRRQEFDVTIAHDELGFRRQEYQRKRSETTRKVLVFGDSFTWGWGVGQGEVLTDQMSLLMPGYHVRNFGLNASGTVHQYKMFEAYTRDDLAEGDTVLVMFFQNDFFDNAYGRVPVQIRDGKVVGVGPARQERPGLRRKLEEASYLLNLMAYSFNYLKAVVGKRLREQQTASVGELIATRPEVVITRHFLEAFQRESAAKKARFVVAYIPTTGEWSGKPAPHDAVLRKAFFNIVRAAGLNAIDLLPAFVEAGNAGGPASLAFPMDDHWNPGGHVLAAHVIASWILERDRETRTPSSE